MSWDPDHLPSQAGRTIVVTGGGAGIGYFVSEQLAGAGARVIMASRSVDKARLAMDAIRTIVPDAELGYVPLDLTSLASVHAAADAIRALGPIDVLVNNAGLVLSPRRRRETADGVELVVGGNFLGHFALTALVFGSIAPGGRVVGLGSGSTQMVRLDATDLYSDRRYRPFRAYAFSKHAVHGFAFELDRRLRAAGDSRASLLAHPGYSSTAWAPRRPGVTDQEPAWRRYGEKVTGIVGQGKDRGAWPVVRAAIDPDAVGGQYYGPAGRLGGAPVLDHAVASSASPEFGALLWADAERRSGVEFSI